MRRIRPGLSDQLTPVFVPLPHELRIVPERGHRGEPLRFQLTPPAALSAKRGNSAFGRNPSTGEHENSSRAFHRRNDALEIGASRVESGCAVWHGRKPKLTARRNKSTSLTRP